MEYRSHYVGSKNDRRRMSMLLVQSFCAWNNIRLDALSRLLSILLEESSTYRH